MAQQQVPFGDEDWSLVEWIQANTRAVTIAGAVLLVAAGGYWYWLRSGEIRRLNAERGLNQAKQSLAAGNPALAATDLQRVATRYTGTPAGVQAALLLAQLHFDAAKYEDGLAALAPYQSQSAAGESLAQVWSLTGDAQLGAGRAADAAAAFQRAVDAARFPGERALMRSKQAKALALAGRTDEARAIWERLSNDPEAALVKSEADVRLGELVARPAGSS